MGLARKAPGLDWLQWAMPLNQTSLVAGRSGFWVTREGTQSWPGAFAQVGELRKACFGDRNLVRGARVVLEVRNVPALLPGSLCAAGSSDMCSFGVSCKSEIAMAFKRL